MNEPPCDFYDWTTHRSCAQPATWVTYQGSVYTRRPGRYYCDAHRPPRAHPLKRPDPSLAPRGDRKR
ncbi:MAG: hypothetical protein DMD69_15460 [Gemmatimonadetes bacterium]|nr:MAG: hypothetical protein DMD69_15460 [Gemmatimonadota bacterium]PYP25350.1 MAG: hypothetical protein DMD55_12660 [Gemmatimonadota bacterium]